MDGQTSTHEIRRTELAELASKAFKLALTSENIIAGFRRTGIWPLNKDALCNDMRPSDAFNLQDDSDAAGIASILRLAGYGEAQVEECLEQCVKQMKELEAQQTEEPTESTCSPSHISQT
ncbi:hypothetical protein SUGI_1112060 [Cryptomeria japonica]|nr:hypothetical protein SUGI_1112060 [Cryptomeria japonica]